MARLPPPQLRRKLPMLVIHTQHLKRAGRWKVRYVFAKRDPQADILWKQRYGLLLQEWRWWDAGIDYLCECVGPLCLCTEDF